MGRLRLRTGQDFLKPFSTSCLALHCFAAGKKKMEKRKWKMEKENGVELGLPRFLGQ
jgi:hypothetical protein